ncbi:SDR family NAD(P)-dependent oxidoreductase [Saccharothrix sp. AJ9571]|nr:SDR family NAD(P)-dependent oxidoreductase [Saccharothrix sp. AJ9571]
MRELVVSGGTTGMGAALARHYLDRGARVTVIGRNPVRGRDFLDHAERIGAAGRAAFIPADLTSVAENRRVIAEVATRHEFLDGLILTAMRAFPRRVETADGFEGHFSLYYTSRYLLSRGLTGLLERGESPMIVSVGGVGTRKGKIHWDDLALRENYGLLRAMLQAGRASELQAVAYVADHPEGRAKYLLFHPGYTDSGYADLPQPKRALMKAMAKLFAQPVAEAIAPITELIGAPPPGRLLAYDRREALGTDLPTLDADRARRLGELTAALR